ncbi:MAG: hypothetical protein VXC58_15510 [Deltaproteobacteria bacterium]|nr:hypothetical protein [SAR324 cluster bacterium]MDP6765028.1 hypothetical protein [SAR324 cluster bacterium]MEC8156785.1 hypothetical protein [SAR324 cluster bacterium]
MDKNGIPGVFLVTEEFQDAASIQCKALGFEPAIYWMPHPVQNRTPEELRQMAKEAAEGVLEMMTSNT